MRKDRMKVLIIEWMAKNPSIDFKEFLELESYCTICGEKYTPRIKSIYLNTYYKCCEECLKKSRERAPWDRELYEERKNIGLCVHCGNPYEVGDGLKKNPLCNECLRKDREYRKDYNLKRYHIMKLYNKEHGKCPSCGRELSEENGKKFCKHCRDKYRNNRTLKYSEKTMNSLNIGDDFPIRAKYRADGEVIESITKIKNGFIVRTNIKEYLFHKLKGGIYINYFNANN